MAVNIGPKIGIDGEKEYRKQINELITQQKTFSAEMKELESSFDSSTKAMDKSRKKGELLEKSIKNQEKQVEELEKGLEASRKKYGENATQTQKWKQAVSNAKTELNKMKTELNKLPKSLSEVGKGMQSVGKKMTSVGDTLTKKVTAPIAAVGAASIAAYKEVDSAMDIIAKKTGATGTALEDLQESAKGIATTIPTSFETAASAVGDVNTKFGLTGTALDDLSTKFVKFAKVNDQDVTASVEGTQKVMAAFGVETKDAGKLLDAMTKTGQKTGISMDTLQTSMVKNGAALQEMGLDAYQAADFLGQVETSGADTSQVMAGLSKALVNANKEGKTLPQALGEFQEIMDSTATDQEKLTAATELFGKKAGPAIYQACQEGSLSFKNFSTDASEYLGAVESTFDAVVDPADEFQIVMNNLKLLGSEVGKSMLTAAAPAIENVGKKLKDAADWFGDLDEGEQTFIIQSALMAAAVGPAISAVGRLTEGVGKVVTAVGEWSGIPASIGALLTNPVAVAALAVGGLIAAFQLLDKDVGYVNESVQETVTGTNEAITALDSATGSLSKTLSDAEGELGDINSQADLADGLIAELAELEKQTNLTAEQQGRMRTIVGELNSMYPDLGIEIDSSTGKLSKSTKEIKAYVEQARKMKLVEAYQKAASKGYEDLAEAHIALGKAQDQQSENQETINGLMEEQARLNSLVDDGNGNLVDSTGEFVMAANALDEALAQNARDLQVANEKQGDLNEATEAAQEVYDNAESTISEYEQAAVDTAAELESMTSSTEDNTGAVEDNTEATEENAAAVESWSSKLAGSVASVIGDIATAISSWNDLYEATRDSISKQIGLFDEWEENHDTTFGDMEKNLQSQITGMKKYNSNMQKLTKAAVDSNDPNFKAFVQALAEMGVGAAGEVDEIVKMMETDETRFNQYLADFGSEQAEMDGVAKTLAYVQNDFTGPMDILMSKAAGSMNKVFGDDVVKKGLKNFGGLVMGAINENKKLEESTTATGKKVEGTVDKAGEKLETTASTSSTKAKSSIETEVGSADPKPEVKKVDVPKTVTDLAKKAISNGVQGAQGSVGKVTGGAAAGRAAKKDAEGQMSDMTGKVTSVSVSQGALWNVKSAISSFLSNNPITAWIKANVTRHAEGGFTYKEQLSWLSEGNQPEVVIPLSTAKRSRALDLYEETGQRLGVASPEVTTKTVSYIDSGDAKVRVKFDTEKLYAACAAGAKQGMENADIKIYLGEREVGRVMRGMGVVFA